jgi:hypothetical protein
MNYQELVSLVGGSNPQSATYEDIVSGIQSQYRPQTQFAPTRSLLDSIGALVPDQPRIAYGALLQPKGLPASVNIGGSIKNPDAAASVDSGVIKSIGTDTGKITDNSELGKTLVYNNDFTNTGTGGLSGVAGGGSNVAATGAVMSGLGVLAGNSDLAKVGGLTNIAGQLLNAGSAEDVLNTLGNVAIGLSGNAGTVGSVVGGLTDNTTLLANSLLSLTSPQLSALNTISNALTGYSFGDIVNGVVNTPEGTVDEYGLLGAANIARTDDASRKAAGAAYDNLAVNDLRVLAELGDQDAKATLLAMAGGGSTYNPITDLGTASGASYWNLFTPVGGNAAKIIQRETAGTSLI